MHHVHGALVSYDVGGGWGVMCSSVIITSNAFYAHGNGYSAITAIHIKSFINISDGELNKENYKNKHA